MDIEQAKQLKFGDRLRCKFDGIVTTISDINEHGIGHEVTARNHNTHWWRSTIHQIAQHFEKEG